MFGAFVSRIKHKSLIIFLFLTWYCFCYSLMSTMCMKLDPGMHIVMHLVFFGKAGVTGEVLPKFCTYSVVFLVSQSRTCRRVPEAPRLPRSSSSALRSCLHSLWLVSTTTLGIIQLFSLPLSYVDRCSPVRRLLSETDTVGDMWIFVYLSDCYANDAELIHREICRIQDLETQFCFAFDWTLTSASWPSGMPNWR
jgi:hypothetical protein